MNLVALPPEFYVAVYADCLEGSLCGGDSDKRRVYTKSHSYVFHRCTYVAWNGILSGPYSQFYITWDINRVQLIYSLTIVEMLQWDAGMVVQLFDCTVLWDFHTRSICSLLKSNYCQKPIKLMFTSIAWLADGSSLICCSFQAKVILVWDYISLMYLNNKLIQHLQV